MYIEEASLSEVTFSFAKFFFSRPSLSEFRTRHQLIRGAACVPALAVKVF